MQACTPILPSSRVLVIGFICLATLPGFPVQWIPKASAQLEEVVVTARRRAENLQETPISVSAISGDQLEVAGISTINDIKSVIPNVQITSTATKAPAVYVRGIGQRQTDPETDPGVGQYLNGIFIARQDALVLDAVDIAGIQVLRGPQGTLFGKNNTGGAMLIETKSPSTEGVYGNVGTTLGSHGRVNVKAAANVPLADNLAVRLNVSSKRFRGYEQDVFTGDWYGDEDRKSFAARTVWNVNDDLSLDFFAFYSKQDERGLAGSCFLMNPEAAIVAFVIHQREQNLGEQCASQQGLAKDEKVAMTAEDSFYTMESRMLALTLDWAMGALDLESTTAWSFQDNVNKVDDVDYTPFATVRNGSLAATRVLEADGIDLDEQQRVQLSQEIKFNGTFFDDKLNLTFGGFYSLELVEDFPNGQIIGANGLIGIPATFLAGLPSDQVPAQVLAVANNAGSNGVLPFLSGNANITNFDNETFAAFVQGSWDLTEQFQATLGVRYTQDKKFRDITNYRPDFNAYGADRGLVHAQGGIYNPISRTQFDQIDVNNPNIPYAPPPPVFEIDETYEQVTPLLTLTWLPGQELLDAMALDTFMVYFTQSQGYKAGGIALRGQVLSQFEPEVLDNTEIGFKLDGFGSRLRLNGAIFRMDYTDIQIRQAEQGPGGVTDIIVFTTNAGEAIVQGAEAEATLALGALTVNASVGYTDAFYDEYMVAEADGSISDRKNEPFALVPEHNRSVLLTYRMLTPIGAFVPTLHYFYQSDVYIGFDAAAINFDDSTLGQAEIFNGRVTWIPDESVRVSLFANNMKDTLDFGGGVSLGDNLGVAGKVRTPPRTYGLEVNWDWSL